MPCRTMSPGLELRGLGTCVLLAKPLSSSDIADRPAFAGVSPPRRCGHGTNGGQDTPINQVPGAACRKVLGSDVNPRPRPMNVSSVSHLPQLVALQAAHSNYDPSATEGNAIICSFFDYSHLPSYSMQLKGGSHIQ